jgi:hypothetical protein
VQRETVGLMIDKVLAQSFFSWSEAHREPFEDHSDDHT